ncbi:MULTISPECIES: CvpA family protein [Campylobacter]|uniref:Membrane protein, CvpA family n=1 Tax=Campylobacter devanensis TaxID=3161138 RepID=A0A1X9SSH6_9BACT|nr:MULTISPECIES: CvpA family protein [Campylobacter]ARQ99214.1 putative membrane protein, CvpA family [Campylobacter lanienae]MEE3693607.1 CvpA family protein [Campylobacter sp. CLAX-22107-21]MEE3711495.1 CvpA family protein [Campylobacter sp. CLAX-7218-21]SUX02399.1 CvpA family protein [Campylobacter lanienae]
MDFITWFDIIIIAVVIILGIKGIINGLIKEVFGLIGIIGGVIIASRNANLVGDLISLYIYQLSDSAEFFFGFLLALLVFWFVCLMLGNLLSKMLKMSGLGFVDRLLGFFVGAAKIFLVLAILAAIVSKISVLNQKISPFFEGSKVYPILLSAGQFIMAMDVSKVKESVESGQIVVPELLDSAEGVEENLTKVEQ